MIIFLIVFVIITLIVCTIWWYTYDCDDLEDFFSFSGGWIPITACIIIGAIIFGFIFWKWWLMLLILLTPIIIIAILIYKSKDELKEKLLKKEKYNSKYKCKNCGASLIYEEEDGKAFYICEHCNVKLTKKDLHIDFNDLKNELDITDFEKEYFESCLALSFSPKEIHSKKQIEFRYNKLNRLIENGEELYNDNNFDDEEILNDAYDYFINNLNEIDEYIKNNDAEMIAKKYDYYKDTLDE